MRNGNSGTFLGLKENFQVPSFRELIRTTNAREKVEGFIASPKTYFEGDSGVCSVSPPERGLIFSEGDSGRYLIAVAER